MSYSFDVAKQLSTQALSQAVALVAHRTRDAVFARHAQVDGGGVRHAAIGAMQQPRAGLRRHSVILSAAQASSASMCREIAHPITRRENRSRLTGSTRSLYGCGCTSGPPPRPD